MKRSKDQDLLDRLAAMMDAPDEQNTKRNGGGYTAASSVSDEQVLEKCRAAKNAAKFSDLFDRGDVHAHHGGDDSRADLGLLGMLAYYTQEEAQLERIFSSSALGQREKWRSRPDYRQRTMARALSQLGETYDWSKEGRRKVSSSPDTPTPYSDDDTKMEPAIKWFCELGDPKPRRFIIEKVGRKGYPLVVYGAGGVAKSFAVLAAGVAIASASGADKWLGLDVLEHGHVLYIDFELDVDEQHSRVVELCHGLGVPVPKRLAYLSGKGFSRDVIFKMARKFAREKDAVAIIVDSVGQAMTADMDRNWAVNAFYRDYIDPFSPMGVTTLLVDHESKLQHGERRKDKGPIGGVFKTNNARSVLQFVGEEYNKETAEHRIRVNTHKTNFEPPDPFGIKVKFEHGKVTITPWTLPAAELLEEPSVPLKKRVVSALDAGSATIAELARITDATEGSIRNKLSELMREEPPVVEGDGGRPQRYKLVSSSSGGAGVSGDDDTKSRYKPGAKDAEHSPGERIARILKNPTLELANQLELCRKDPERLIPTTCKTIAIEVYGDEWKDRWEEVRPVLEAHLGEGN